MRHPSRTATVIGIAALLAVAAGTGATAATLITGAQIKDGTVTGADIKNGSVKSADIGDGSVTGTDIKNGSVGNADVAGGYYTRAQVDAKIPKSGELNIPGTAFQPLAPSTITVPDSTGCVRNGSGDFRLRAPVVLPVGATITQIRGRIIDNSASISTVAVLSLLSDNTLLGGFSTSWDLPNPVLQTGNPLSEPKVVQAGENIHLRWSGGDGTADFQLCGAAVRYTLP